MKKILGLFIGLLFLVGCGNTSETNNIVANTSTSMKIEGMTCQEMCAGRIEEKIARMNGVSTCEVDFENEMATIRYDKKMVDIDKVVLKVEDMNDGQYTISEVKTENVNSSSSDMKANGGNETGQILSAPSFELPNLAEYFRNII